MTTGDWASVAAAAFAAVAATAAWSTVLLSIRRDRALHKPNVYAAFTTKGRLKPPELVFNNGGPGLAVGLLYLGVLGVQRFLGYIREDRRHVLDETTDTRLSRMFERMFPNVDVPW